MPMHSSTVFPRSSFSPSVAPCCGWRRLASSIILPRRIRAHRRRDRGGHERACPVEARHRWLVAPASCATARPAREGCPWRRARLGLVFRASDPTSAGGETRIFPAIRPRCGRKRRASWVLYRGRGTPLHLRAFCRSRLSLQRNDQVPCGARTPRCSLLVL
jgi:hypothetical protein